MLNALRPVAAIALPALLFASAPAPLANTDPVVAVSPLEAIHVAEIHTGQPVADFHLFHSEGAHPVYRIHTGNETALEVTVDARHGRLLEIRHTAPSNAATAPPAYRWPGIRVVAHRGGVRLGPPENTLPAIEAAIAIGADLIEIDIRQTADGHLVLMHDQTVDRTTSGTGPVADLTLAEFRTLRILTTDGTVLHPPTLDEALARMKGRIDADLDFKQGDVRTLIDAVRKAGMTEHSTFCGPWERCQNLADLEPRIRIRPTADLPEQVPFLVRQLNPALVNLDWHAVTEQSVRSAHLGGCHAFVNCLGSADTEANIRRAIAIGADYIQSDQPDLVIRILKETGLRSAPVPPGDPLGTPRRHSRLGYPFK